MPTLFERENKEIKLASTVKSFSQRSLSKVVFFVHLPWMIAKFALAIDSSFDVISKFDVAISSLRCVNASLLPVSYSHSGVNSYSPDWQTERCTNLMDSC